MAPSSVTTQTPEHKSRAEEIREALVQRIVSGALKPGDRLPAERILASEYGVSRNVLREAIGSLSAMNLLDAQRGAGVFVAKLDIASLVEPIQLATSLGPSNLRSVIQTRLVVEPGIAALAAQLGSGDDIDRLHELLCASEEAVDNAEVFLDLDVDVHDAIVRMTRNPVLMRISDAIRRLARASREYGNTERELREGAVVGHRAIYAAIAVRDADKAEQAMREHLLSVENHLLGFRIELRPSSVTIAPTRVG